MLTSMKKALIITQMLGLSVISQSALGGTLAERVADLNPNGKIITGSTPNGFWELGDNVLFSAYDVEHGNELWIYNKASHSASLLKDINPGQGNSYVRSVVQLGSKLLFAANDGQHGDEYWISDGTEVGTHLLYDSNPGSADADGLNIVAFTRPDGKIVFQGNSYLSPFISDGTESGTSVDNEQADRDTLDALRGIAVAGYRYYIRAVGNFGYQWWRKPETGGVPEQVAMPETQSGNSSYVFDVNGFAVLPDYQDLWSIDSHGVAKNLTNNACSPSYRSLVTGTGKAFFQCYIGGRLELWTTQGTPETTKKVSSHGADNLYGALIMDGQLLFLGSQAELGEDGIYLSDGTESGTRKIAGTGSNFDISKGVQLAHKAILYSRNTDHSLTIYSVDGETGSLVKLYQTSGEANELRGLGIVDGKLLLSANGYTSGGNGETLLSTDGTQEGTIKIATMDVSEPTFYNPNYRIVANKLYFAGDDHVAGIEPWVTDGTISGTHLLANIGAESNAYNEDSFPSRGLLKDGYQYFVARASNDANFAIWRSKGDSSSTVVYNNNFSSEPRAFFQSLFTAGDSLLTQASDWNSGYLLSLTTPEHGFDLVLGATDSVGLVGELDHEKLLAMQVGGSNGLWITNGTASGTRVIKNTTSTGQGFSPQEGHSATEGYPVINHRAYFSGWSPETGRELWSTDGTVAGTQQVVDIIKGDSPSNPAHFAVSGKHLFFTAYGQGSSTWLYFYDPSSNALRNLAETSPEGSDVVTIGNHVLFTGHDNSHGYELWSVNSDGSSPGLLKDFSIGSGNTNFSHFTRFNGSLYFIVRYQLQGHETSELWMTDGTSQNTRKVSVPSGYSLSSEEDMIASAGHLFFIIEDADTHMAIAQIVDGRDGTQSAIVSQSFQSLTNFVGAVSGNLLFSAKGDDTGVELWRLAIEDMGAPQLDELSGLTVEEGQSVAPIQLGLKDRDNSFSEMSWQVVSDNQSLLPNSNLSIEADSVSAHMLLAPVSGKVGQARVTVTAYDGEHSASRNFVINVTPKGSPSPTPVPTPTPGTDSGGGGGGGAFEFISLLGLFGLRMSRKADFRRVTTWN